jgi:hypothetical protein
LDGVSYIVGRVTEVRKKRARKFINKVVGVARYAEFWNPPFFKIAANYSFSK